MRASGATWGLGTPSQPRPSRGREAAQKTKEVSTQRGRSHAHGDDMHTHTHTLWLRIAEKLTSWRAVGVAVLPERGSTTGWTFLSLRDPREGRRVIEGEEVAPVLESPTPRLCERTMEHATALTGCEVIPEAECDEGVLPFPSMAVSCCFPLCCLPTKVFLLGRGYNGWLLTQVAVGKGTFSD
jgi:hypothetical protein